MNLPLIITCVGFLSVYDNSKNINQYRWNNCIISDMGYHSTTNKHLLKEMDYFILLRFLGNSHWELFYDRNDNRAIFSTKLTAKNRLYHQIMKFCDKRTKYILTGNQKYIENEMCKSFYGLLEESDFFENPAPFGELCKTSLHEREKYYKLKNIQRLNITQEYINNNPTKSDKQDESILQHIPEQDSIPVLFKPKIEREDISDKENDNRICLYNLCYIKKTHSITKYQNIN